MAALSTLELMLHELQHQEKLDHSCDHGKMPMLPQRPVSKARIPTKRARRAILSFYLQDFGGKKEEFVDSKNKRDGFEFIDGGIVLSKNKTKNDGEEKGEKGIIGIQKCFRGYQARLHYHKLKEGMITLQSFIRGEKARRQFQNSTKWLTQTHINQDFVWKPLRNRETTIIYLQSVIRAWLTRRHLGYTENTAFENTREVNYMHNEKIESEEHVTVSESYMIRDLEQQVLKTETALRNKIHENAILELQIQQIDRKWELHNAKMNSKEKTWQDEFTTIQMNLASARERTTKEIIRVPQNVPQRQENEKMNLTIRQILEVQESDYSFHMENMSNSRKDNNQQELRKLKCRFKAWKTEFKARLYEIKRTLDRFDHCRTERVHKSCFVS